MKGQEFWQQKSNFTEELKHTSQNLGGSNGRLSYDSPN